MMDFEQNNDMFYGDEDEFEYGPKPSNRPSPKIIIDVDTDKQLMTVNGESFKIYTSMKGVTYHKKLGDYMTLLGTFGLLAPRNYSGKKSPFDGTPDVYGHWFIPLDGFPGQCGIGIHGGPAGGTHGCIRIEDPQRLEWLKALIDKNGYKNFTVNIHGKETTMKKKVGKYLDGKLIMYNFELDSNTPNFMSTLPLNLQQKFRMQDKINSSFVLPIKFDTQIKASDLHLQADPHFWDLNENGGFTKMLQSHKLDLSEGKFDISKTWANLDNNLKSFFGNILKKQGVDVNSRFGKVLIGLVNPNMMDKGALLANKKIGNSNISVGAAVGAGADLIGSLIKDRPEYSGKEGNITLGIDSAYNAASNAAMSMGPYGMAIGAAMKVGGLANKAIGRLGGGTDGMTKTDAILGSNLLGLTPLGLLNGFFGKRSKDYSRNLELDSATGTGFGGFLSAENSAEKVANKKYGLFSSGARNDANALIDFTSGVKHTVSNIVDTNTINNLAAQGSTPFLASQQSINLSGGVGQMLAAKHGMKFAKAAVQLSKKYTLIPINKSGGQVEELTDKQKEKEAKISTEIEMRHKINNAWPATKNLKFKLIPVNNYYENPNLSLQHFDDKGTPVIYYNPKSPNINIVLKNLLSIFRSLDENYLKLITSLENELNNNYTNLFNLTTLNLTDTKLTADLIIKDVLFPTEYGNPSAILEKYKIDPNLQGDILTKLLTLSAYLYTDGDIKSYKEGGNVGEKKEDISYTFSPFDDDLEVDTKNNIYKLTFDIRDKERVNKFKQNHQDLLKEYTPWTWDNLPGVGYLIPTKTVNLWLEEEKKEKLLEELQKLSNNLNQENDYGGMGGFTSDEYLDEFYMNEEDRMQQELADLEYEQWLDWCAHNLGSRQWQHKWNNGSTGSRTNIKLPQEQTLIHTSANMYKEGGIVPKFMPGGEMNVIPEGALHKNKHHLEDVDDKFEDVTEKGIPVITEDFEGNITQHAEVEKEEIIFCLEVTLELEKLMKENTDESAIKAGKLVADEILNNTKDNAGIIDKNYI